MIDNFFVAAETDEEWDIHLNRQQGNRPDLNIIDLFRALQSAGQWDSMEESAFPTFDAGRLNCSTFNITGNDNNNFEILHTEKAALEWVGVLLDRQAAGEGAIELARTFLGGPISWSP